MKGTVSLCIQIAIDKIQLCSLSVAYACPYQNIPVTVLCDKTEDFRVAFYCPPAQGAPV